MAEDDIDTVRACAEGTRRALSFAARHINASASNPIDEHTLLRSVVSGRVPDGQWHHLFAFFDETDTAILADLAISGDVTYAQLASLSDALLPNGHPTKEWLDARRDL